MSDEQSKSALSVLLDDPVHMREMRQILLDTSPNVIVMVDLEGRVLAANRALETFFALSPETAVTMTLDQLLDHVALHTDEEPRMRSIVEQVRAPHDRSLRIDLWHHTFRTVRPKVAEFHIYAAPILDGRGAEVGRFWTLFDVTEMRRSEAALRQTQTQLMQAEKMASLGMLVAGIAHEINTPIGAVASMHDTLVKAIDKLLALLHAEAGPSFIEMPKVAQTLKIIEDSNRVIADGSSRVTDIVRRLRSFARLDEAELKDVDLNHGLNDTLSLIQHELKQIDVVCDLGSLPLIPCYPGRINQVFLNLLINARQAITGRGEIRIQTRAEGDRVRVSISDTGSGIPKENLPRIFDPGFTTKGVGVGTGLGLSICFQIVEEHHGRISATSELGKGSTFTVEIPRTRP